MMRRVSWLLMATGIAGLAVTVAVITQMLQFGCGYTKPCRRSTAGLWADFLRSGDSLVFLVPAGLCVALLGLGIWLDRRDRAHRRQAGTRAGLRR